MYMVGEKMRETPQIKAPSQSPFLMAWHAMSKPTRDDEQAVLMVMLPYC
jgi:hypothetical protein